MISSAKSEPAVSPVIGTILLVAIAVVLVAVILAVVMGFSGDTNEKKVGMNAKSADGSNATLILYGGASIDELVKLEMIDQDSPYGSYVKLWEKTSSDSETVFVGLPYLAESVAQPAETMDIYDTRINVRGTFSDGSEVILLVQPMTFYDVTGSDANSDNQITTPPEIGVPSFTSINYTSFTVYLPYSKADPTPSSAVIYYTNISSGETKQITTTDLDISKSRFTATITGVAVNTSYDVKGDIIVKKTTFTGTKNNTVKTMVPTLNAPTFSSLKATQFTAAFVYKADSVPSSAEIYYRDVTNNGPTLNVTVTDVTASPIRVSINGLNEDIQYEVWGEMTTVSGTYQSTSSNKITTSIPVMNAPGFSTIKGDQFTATFYYSRTDAPPSSAEVYYRDVTNNGPTKSVTVTDITSSPIIATITGLTEKTEYEVWGNMTTSSGTYSSAGSKTVTTKTPTMNAPSFGSIYGDRFTAAFYYSNTDAPPSSAEVYYRDVTNNGPTESITVTGITSSPIRVAITGLTGNTEYEVWGKMTTSSGTHSSAGSNTVITS